MVLKRVVGKSREGDTWAKAWEKKKQALQVPRGRTFQAEGPASAKTLKQKYT